MENLYSSLRELIALLFPGVCVRCETLQVDVRNHLCPACLNAMVEKIPAHIYWQKVPSTPKNFFPVFSLAEYDADYQKLIHAFKFARLRRLGQPLSWLFMQIPQELFNWDQFDAMVVVPTSDAMFRKRHFDHMDILARHIAHRLKKNKIEIPRLKHLIQPAAKGPPQVGLGRLARRRNAEASLHLGRNLHSLANVNHVLILDDIITTGATFSRVGQLLLAHKPTLQLTGLSLLRVKNP